MDKQQAQNIVRETFEKPFDRERFVYFIKNLLNRIDDSKAFHARGYVPEIFKDHVKTYERIGTYTDPEDNKTDILVVYLQKETALDRARTTQRNFIARYLKDRGEKDAGLIAFVSPDEEDWRFSFVKMEYRLAETPTGRIKAEEDFTPARRYSYLVGKNENSHTAQSRLLPLLINDNHNPQLNEIEEAFSIEKVTKEFFEKYRDLFMRTKEALDEIIKKNEKVKNDFRQRSVNTVDFSKKLLGQIVFLYFLQKKGWFGVARDAGWGTGPRNFLRLLFEKRLSNYQNFFNDILEPLFYEALAIERQADFYSRFNCKIPFLNGGLFDPINNYDWVHTDVLLPDELFSNDIKTKEGDIGTGILDVFDRYNFTVKEDEPLEKEVAVDPEMLGKVFENLLEVKDRKSKGTYYTPREIVHYMCQESLINYLDNVINTSKEVIVAQKAVQKKLIGEDDPEQLGITEQKQKTVIPKEDIESFIRHGISAIEHDRRVEAKGYETRDYSYRMPDSIRLNARLFDNALQAVKICDPAVGSGAFLVGMMHEIIRARETLTTYLGDNERRTPYKFKHHAIQDCLYGVDIDQGAVEIAKLRLWLSLMVDEEDIKHIKPLPNLDYKIVCGNSLLGINNLFHHAQLKKLEELKGRFFEETNSKKKSQLKEDIGHLINEITHDDKHFDFKVYFSEVFHQKGGFDIVIANPPYVSHDKIKEKAEIKSQYLSYEPFADIYCYFIERAINLQNEQGLLCYITSNSYLRAAYGKFLRKLLKEKNYLLNIINIEDSQVFDSAIVNVAILISASRAHLKRPNCHVVNSPYNGHISFEQFVQKEGFNYSQDVFSDKPWSLSTPELFLIQKKIESNNKTLEQLGTKIRLGLATGHNEAFIIGEAKKRELCRLQASNEEIIKPILRGRDIARFNYTLPALHILLAKNGINVKKDYPHIYKHFESYGESFKKRGARGQHWTNLRACSFFDDFKEEKIIWIELADVGRFALCREEVYLLNSAYFLLPPKGIDAKYLLGLLNSTVIRFYLGLIAETSGMGTSRWINNFVKEFPIPLPSSEHRAVVISLVDQILSITQGADYLNNPEKQSRVSALERQIDKMVYNLYDLTPEEIAIVEGK